MVPPVRWRERESERQNEMSKKYFRAKMRNIKYILEQKDEKYFRAKNL